MLNGIGHRHDVGRLALHVDMDEVALGGDLGHALLEHADLVADRRAAELGDAQADLELVGEGDGPEEAAHRLDHAAVEAMDTEIGRLLLSVNAATTDVIFIGDNGTPGQVIQAPYDASHAKDTLYEGGIRVPLIIKGPSVVSGGRTSDSLVQAADLFSTMLEMAGVPLPTTVTLDSKSLKPILSNQSGTRTRIYTDQFDQASSTAGGRVLRDDRYKLIRFNNGTEEFHDVVTDPADTTDLLTGGIGAMSATQQARYYRLRFNQIGRAHV